VEVGVERRVVSETSVCLFTRTTLGLEVVALGVGILGAVTGVEILGEVLRIVVEEGLLLNDGLLEGLLLNDDGRLLLNEGLLNELLRKDDPRKELERAIVVAAIRFG
jgi:hypothetical protein